MKKIAKSFWVLSLSLSLCTVCLNAQTSFFVGPMATGHISKLNVSGDYSKVITPWGDDGGDFIADLQNIDSKSLIGYSGGLTLGFKFNRFSVMTGGRFVQKGGKFESRDYNFLVPNYDLAVPQYFDLKDVGTLKIKETQNYIQIPLLVRYQIFGKDVGVTLSLGPAFNIGIGSATQDISFEGLTESETFPPNKHSFGKDIQDAYKPQQTSFIISPGVALPLGENGRLNINLFWEKDFSTSINENYRFVFTDPYGTTSLVSLDGEKKSKSFGISISYEHHLEFRIGDKY